jgi:hypothetical protein
MTAGAAVPRLEFHFDGLGLAKWRDVIDAHAGPEPCRPGMTRGLDQPAREAMVAQVLGLDRVPTRTIFDYSGGAVYLRRYPLVGKLGRYANHAAYAGWIEQTLRAPLEVWRHVDPRRPNGGLRSYYLAAYLGPDGATSHLLICAVANRALINCFRLDGSGNADENRFGQMMHIGYEPIFPPLPLAKGAPFPAAPFK